MKIFLPVHARCPNVTYHRFGRNENSPGCPAHRQPLLCASRRSLYRCLTRAASNLTLAHQPMSCFPYGTLAEITQEIRSKSVSPVEIVELQWKRIETLQPKLNAFVHLDPEGAREQARAAENLVLRGAQLGPLHGVTLSIKSCIDVAGWPCPAGSLLRKTYVANLDAPLVSRLKAAGAILLGNTNTPEFLMAYETDNRLTGKTSNPWDLTHSAGGSSGGEAAAIAAGCSAGGVGRKANGIWGERRVGFWECGDARGSRTSRKITRRARLHRRAFSAGWTRSRARSLVVFLWPGDRQFDPPQRRRPRRSNQPD